MEKPIEITTFTDSGPLYLYDTDNFDPVFRVERVVMDRCAYCGQWAPEFDACPHCGAPYTPVKP